MNKASVNGVPAVSKTRNAELPPARNDPDRCRQPDPEPRSRCLECLQS